MITAKRTTHSRRPTGVAALVAALAAAVALSTTPETANAYAYYSDGGRAEISFTIQPVGTSIRTFTIVASSNVPFSFRVRNYNSATGTATWSGPYYVGVGINPWALTSVTLTGPAVWHQLMIEYQRPGFPRVTELALVRNCSLFIYGHCQVRTDGWAFF
jgi:hypothetical protein